MRPPTSFLTTALLAAQAAAAGSAASDLYDPDPAHPWNRAHAAICARVGPDGATVGLDSPFPLIWWGSDHLLEDGRFAELLAALEGLVTTAQATAAQDVRARVLMQSDLWALFDWAAAEESREPDPGKRAAIALAAARALRALAPREEELAALADPLVQACASGALPERPEPGEVRAAFLPADLAAGSARTGAWILLRDQSGTRETPLAAGHAWAFGGRASFAAYLAAPDGRDATLGYLALLRAHPGVIGCDADCGPGAEGRHAHLDPALPPPPPGTQVALVQRLLAFDDRGELHATPVTLGVQLREFLAVPADAPAIDAQAPFPEAWPYQAFAELRLDRRRFLDGAEDGTAALVPLGPDEEAFDLFGAHGDEVDFRLAFDARHARLAACTQCHGIPGAPSLGVYTGVSSSMGTHLLVPLATPVRPLAEDTPKLHALRATRFKSRRYDWGVLRGMWAADG